MFLMAAPSALSYTIAMHLVLWVCVILENHVRGDCINHAVLSYAESPSKRTPLRRDDILRLEREQKGERTKDPPPSPGPFTGKFALAG
ncbi:hypothetical protein BJV77DRAFT_1068951 [Russula vinacea]|nr:hypothetical protein BJV77DRAFT_1068951 [Russula vinacea]